MEPGIRRIFQFRALVVQSSVHSRFQLAEAVLDAFEDKEGYLALRKRLDGYLNRFAAELKDDDLAKFLDYKDSHGDPHHQEFGLVVLHVFNHQTHHRGMVSIYLEEMGVQNDYSNIMDMI